MNVDTDYFTKKLNLVIRDIHQYTAEELSLELYRLASTANPTIQSARINELGRELTAEREAREKAEQNNAELYAAFNREICGDVRMGEPSLQNKSLIYRLRELDIKGYQPTTGAIGEEAANALESAEARIKASQEQEPFYYHADCDDVDRSALCNTLADAQTLVNDYGGEVVELYVHPPTPPEVAELQRENEELRADLSKVRHALSAGMRENAELTRKLAEHQAIQIKIANFLQNESGLEGLRNIAQSMLDCFKFGKEELERLLSEARNVPEVTDAMALAFHRALTDGTIGAGEIEEIKIGLRAAMISAPAEYKERT